MKYLIGIDEVGRGPLAGPVTIGIVMIPKKKKSTIFKTLRKLGLNDSKQVTEERREKIYRSIDGIDFVTVSVGSKYIDTHGISKAIRTCIGRGLKRLVEDPKECDVKLDGLLKAPKEYKQETIIKGDTKEEVIMLASIVAKVKRDRYMKKISKRYPVYGFDVHKGYGTKRHREAISKHGMCEIHRRGYCGNIDIM
ncbi:MAG: ribonuclease HII [Candidatus Paceibacteria bacterium]|jgi:ribonuclease HII